MREKETRNKETGIYSLVKNISINCCFKKSVTLNVIQFFNSTGLTFFRKKAKIQKVGLCGFLLFLCCISLFSQENSIYDNDYLTPFITNPACTGVEYYPVVALSARKQWLGFSDSPSTYLLSGTFRIGTYDFYNPKGLVNKGPFTIKDRFGLGAAVFQDNNGPLVNNGGMFSIAYHLPVSRRSRLSFGLSMIVLNHSVSTSMLEPSESNDAYLLTAENDGFKINVGSGLYYHNSTWFAGVSMNKILQDVKNANEEDRQVSSYFLMGGYKFDKDNKSFNYEPSFSVKMLADEDIMVDVHMKVYIKRLNWAAISYSTSQTVNGQFAIKLYRKVYAGYNYGFTFGNISSYNYGTHEISLGINLGLVGVEGLKYSLRAK